MILNKMMNLFSLPPLYKVIPYNRKIWNTFVVLFICCSNVHAFDFEVNGIYYNLINESEVEVTFKTEYGYIGGSYSGEVILSGTITYSGKTYQVTSIGERAFFLCNNLTSVQMPNTILRICEEAFCRCENLKYLTISQSLKEIGVLAFGSCESLGEISLPDGLQTIGAGAFLSCKSIKSIVIPNSVISINTDSSGGGQPFSSCTELESIIVGPNNSYFDSRNNCNAIINKNNNTLIAGCKNTQIPDDVKCIGSGAFSGCIDMQKITIPNSISSIEKSAFYYCTKLQKVISKIKQPFNINSNVFEGIPSNSELYVPNGTRDQYLALSGWSNCFKEIIEEQGTIYTLRITASGYGYANYNGNSTRNDSRIYALEKGKSATIFFSSDNGYRIASVKVNESDVTADVANNQYTISNIAANTTVSVSFEAIPQTTYTLSITASGYGSATYNGTSARNQTRTFTVNEGSSATISFSPDNGYRIASVKVNNADVTGASVTSNRYTISNINANTTVAVTFEEIPPTTHSLSIKVSGNGYVLYNDTYFRNKTNYYTVSHGSSETIAINPDVGYRLSNMKVNNKDVTSNVMDNSYTITNITADTNVEVTFEEIPPTTFSLSITASGNGSATYNGTSARNQTRTFTVNEGSSATVSFTPDNGYRIGSVKVNNTDVTANVTNNQYTVSDILTNTSVSVTFADIEYDNLSNNGVNYRVVSNPNKTVSVANGSYGYWLTVPASFTANGIDWAVTGIDNDVLSNNPQLAAVIWNPSTQFTASVTNPNFLLYVTSSQYAPSAIKNVVVGNTANIITLTDASSGNNFYCPREFTARSISYSHSYGMTTGISEARGWESISLPFNVETITHSSKGTLVPFTNWQEGGSTKPFWLYQLGSGGFAEASSIIANTPYIISMPNNAEYLDEYRVSGTITFSSTDVTVKSSESLQNGTYGDRTFIPNFINQDANSGFYVLNSVNNYSANSSGYAEGSRFVRNLRAIHPFEAYIASANNAKESIPIFDDETTWIRSLSHIPSPEDKGGIYDLSGRRIQGNKVTEYQSDQFPALQGGVRDRLQKGVYIVNGKKIVIR